MLTFSSEPIVYGLIFVAVLVLVEGAYLVAFGKSISLNKRVNRRLELLDKGTKREEVLAKLRKEMDQHMSSRGLPLYSILADRAQKAAIAFTPKQLIMIMVAVSFLSFVGLTIGTEAGLGVCILMGIGMGVGGVFFWINKKAKKRISMIEEQLPDAVELMVRSLRVGHPFSSAISIVSKEIKDPLATEFGLIADESSYGRDIGEALKAMAERLDMQDLRFLAVAVSIQQQSGGNLAEILDGLAKVIRARFRLFRRVKAITAEAKWSGNFLSGFPVAALVGIQLLDPNYYDNVLDHPWFIPACFLVGAFLVANLLVMRQLVDIKV
jgi:tight adherence protein B